MTYEPGVGIFVGEDWWNQLNSGEKLFITDILVYPGKRLRNLTVTNYEFIKNSFSWSTDEFLNILEKA